jgi:hypothetical protein
MELAPVLFSVPCSLMSACQMNQIRDGFVREAHDLARTGDADGAQERLDHAAQNWPLEPGQIEWVQRALDEARAERGEAAVALRDPNGVGD